MTSDRLADAEEYTRYMAHMRKHHGALQAFVDEYDRRGELLLAYDEATTKLEAKIEEQAAELEAYRAPIADCGICKLGARTIFINDKCPEHGDQDGLSW